MISDGFASSMHVEGIQASVANANVIHHWMLKRVELIR